MGYGNITTFFKLPTKTELAAARREAESISQLYSQRPALLAHLSAGNNKNCWPVKVEKCPGGYYYISGRGSGLNVYIQSTIHGYLLSVPNFNRCGYVPGDCDRDSIMEYVGIDNKVDAESLAVGVRWLISQGYAQRGR